jgi:protein-S-isoprenylcysteine O-methyltransferase Ste14
MTDREVASPWVRPWLWLPDGVFRTAGALVFFAYAFARIGDYRHFPHIGPWWWAPIGEDAFGFVHYGPRHYFPIARIVTDVTFLLIALSFCLRVPPRRRADSAARIVVPLIGGFWPFLPFAALAVLKALHSPWQLELAAMLAPGEIAIGRFSAAVVAMSVGNLLDVWAYATLLHSFSIVAEARELKVVGPYRFVRHPIYLGQLIAQGAFWLLLTRFQWMWVAFFTIFVALQLYRARVEERVLENAFGEAYRSYERRTFWFV